MTCNSKQLYVMAKLTLHVPDELVVAAKSEAAARQVSVSKLVTDFFRNLASRAGEEVGEDNSLAPRTRRLAGCIPNADIEDYIDYLDEKHS
ncbi:MAG: hypothetical protein KA250_19365 [Verrucomicrobiales bacterium]|nr:hypothetical protein [Verrucomicrobiales bacterium]